MSHFTRIKTKIVDQACLLKALADLGYHTVEVGSGLNLFGYHGDMRPDTAEVVVRRKYLTSASNDIGFKLLEDGTYEAIVSEYDTHALRGWLDNVTQRYAYNVVKQQAEWQGYQVIGEETQVDGTIQLVFQRW